MAEAAPTAVEAVAAPTEVVAAGSGVKAEDPPHTTDVPHQLLTGVHPPTTKFNTMKLHTTVVDPTIDSTAETEAAVLGVVTMMVTVELTGALEVALIAPNSKTDVWTITRDGALREITTGRNLVTLMAGELVFEETIEAGHPLTAPSDSAVPPAGIATAPVIRSRGCGLTNLHELSSRERELDACARIIVGMSHM